MEGSLTRIGGKTFPVKSSGGLLGQNFDQVNYSLYYNRLASTVALVSLAGTASISWNFDVTVSNKPTVLIRQIQVFAFFVDGATATYNVTSLVSIFIPQRFYNDDANSGSYRFSQAWLNSGLELQIEMPLVNRAFNISAEITGGDVQRITGITPGAGDTVQFVGVVSYYV